MGMIMFYVTYPTKEVAAKISDILVKERLVACSNLHPIESTYHWKGAIESDDEWVGVYKTSYANVGKVEARIESLHPYEVPCILHWEFSCNFAYEMWLRKNIEE